MCLRRNRSRREISLDDVKSEPEELLPAEIPDRAKDPAEIYEQRENERILCEAINQLSAEFQAVVCLRLEERTVSETAEILGVGIATLKARLFRARQKLRALVTRSPELRGDRTMSKTRQRRGGDLKSHPPVERTTSRGSRAVGSKPRSTGSEGWGWKRNRERALQSAESRMLEVA